MNKGMIVGQVTRFGVPVEKGYLWIDSIQSAQIGGIRGSRVIQFKHPEGFPSVTCDTQKKGAYALCFLWEGYDIAAAVDQLRFTVTCTVRDDPRQPSKRQQGVFKHKVRLDQIYGHPSLSGLSIDVWKEIRTFKLPRTFLTRSALSTEMYSIVGISNFHF